MRTTDPGGAALGSARAVWLVTDREMVTRLRSRAFVLSTIAMLVIVGGYLAFATFVGQRASTSTVALTGQAKALAGPLTSAAERLGGDVDTRTLAGPAEGRRLVHEDKADALVTGSPGELRVVVEDELDATLRAALNTVARQQALSTRLQQAGVDAGEVRRAVVAAEVEVRSLEPADPQRGQRLSLALVVSGLLYVGLTLYGNMVAQGVVEEKSSRVVELLLSTVRPWQLMAGKVLGVGVVGLVQLAIIGGVGVGVAAGAGVLTLPAAGVGTLVWALVWYLLGFFLFATAFAGAGALVSRQEDLQTVVTPVIAVILVPFLLAATLLPQNPDSRLIEVLSVIPPFGPILMPARIALGLAPAWQIALSAVLTVAAFAGLVRLASAVYASAVLRTGSRVSLRDALRAG